MAPRTQYMQTDHGRVAYQVFGEGRLEIVYIPGFVSNVEMQWADPAYARFLNRLGGLGRVVIYDPLGIGASDPLPTMPSVDQKTAELEALLDHVGFTRPLLFGVSLGSAGAFSLAARHPERVLGLVA